MSIEINVLSEMWLAVKEYIPSKDRQECAHNLMSMLVDILDDKQLKEFSVADSILKRAFSEYNEEDQSDDETDW
jgi:hypothetical protein